MLPTIISLAPHILQAPLQVRLRRLNPASKLCASVLRATARQKRGRDQLQRPRLSVPLMVEQKMKAAWVPESQHGAHLFGRILQTCKGLCMSKKYTLALWFVTALVIERSERETCRTALSAHL